MIFRKRVEDPKPILRIGMFFLALALVWPRLLPVTGNLSTDAIDGINGLLMGLAIGLNLWAVILGSRLRRAGRQNRD
jgi:hypothetical protein